MDTVSQFRYRPAGASGWLAVANPGRLLVVHPDAVGVGVAVFERGSDGDSGEGFQVALDELTRGGLSSTPRFALLEWSGAADERSLRVIVRGGVKVAVSAEGTQHTLDGTGVSTWTEQSFRKVADFEVAVVPAPEATFTGELWLPLDGGIAVVARVASAAGGAAEVPVEAVATKRGSRPSTSSGSEGSAGSEGSSGSEGRVGS